MAHAVGRLAALIPVSIASGREPSDVLRFADELGLEAPQISDNGAVILDPAAGEALHSFIMPAPQAEQVVRYLDARRIAFIATHAADTAAALSEIPTWKLARVSALDLDEAGAEDVAAAFRGDPKMHVVKASLPYNGLWAVDFTRVGIDKASAVRRVADALGTDARRTIAIGDSYNDVSMLRNCGLSIAMGGSPDEVRAAADHVVPPVDDDGLAVAIEKLILPRLAAWERPSVQ